jgi:RHS repeat-associated protein
MELTDEKQLVQAEDGEDIEIQQNGDIYVYVSNSANIPMFFDDLRVLYVPGALVEETHYYPFGLVMKGISTKAMNGVLDNKCQYNGKEEQQKEFSDGSGLEWLDYGARMYDDQVGRWMAVDPKAHLYFGVTPFAYCANNPIVFIDPDGKVIRDSKGEVVFVPVAKIKLEFPDKKMRDVEAGYIFGNDGTRILVYQNLTSDKGADTDCHGVSFVDGKYWMDNSQVPTLLKADKYQEVEEKSSKKADVVVYTDKTGNVEDSKTVVTNDKNGIKVYGQGGMQEKNSTTGINTAWKKGSPRHVFRKTQKDQGLDQSGVNSMKNTVNSSTVSTDMDRSKKLN